MKLVSNKKVSFGAVVVIKSEAESGLLFDFVSFTTQSFRLSERRRKNTTKFQSDGRKKMMTGSNKTIQSKRNKPFVLSKFWLGLYLCMWFADSLAFLRGT